MVVLPECDVMSEQIAVPQHIAFIMDGNGRWARSRFLPRVEGHRAGAKTVRMVVEECRRLGVRYLTLFSFSTENWGRPEEEVGALMHLLRHHLMSELTQLSETGIRLRAIGDLSRLPAQVRDALDSCAEQTKDNTGMDLMLALSYGGRDEIVNAARCVARQVADGSLSPEQIDEKVFSSFLYSPDVPDPDLLIRTGNEWRISNFLLWQLAYSEIVVSPLHWPAFSKDELYRCLSEFGARERRFGLTGEQIKKVSNVR